MSASRLPFSQRYVSAQCKQESISKILLHLYLIITLITNIVDLTMILHRNLKLLSKLGSLDHDTNSTLKANGVAKLEAEAHDVCTLVLPMHHCPQFYINIDRAVVDKIQMHNHALVNIVMYSTYFWLWQ